MESTLTPSSLLSSLLQDASGAGEILSPSALLDALTTAESCTSAVLDLDQANRFFDAFHSQFGFIRDMRFGRALPDETMRHRWVALLRWLLGELQAWRSVDDEHRCKMVAIFVVAQASEIDGEFWTYVPNDSVANTALCDSLKATIGSMTAALQANAPFDTPISDAQISDRLRIADEEGNWSEFVSLRLIGTSVTNFYVSQAVRYLSRASMPHLVDAVAGLSQSMACMMIANALSVSQRLQLALYSESRRMHFACAYATLLEGKTTSLSVADQDLLTTLLINVADDEQQWQAWMSTFNAYPQRYPTLQAPLGRALARMPRHALETYVNSIVLHPIPLTHQAVRGSVADCLRAFSGAAALETRQLVWRLSHERWSKWNFDEEDSDAYLVGAQGSALDFAVVAFACECMNAAERDGSIEMAMLRLCRLDEIWHSSASAMRTAWVRLLSHLQPYCHARSCSDGGGDLLQVLKVYRVFDPTSSAYALAKYGCS